MGLSEELKQLAENTNWIADELELAKARDDRGKTYDFWKTLRKANKDYLELDVTGEGTFIEFMKYNYGVQLHTDAAGNYTAQFEIINEHHYLLFKLKYE